MSSFGAGYDQILRTHIVGDEDNLAWFDWTKVADTIPAAVQEFVTDLAFRQRRERVGHMYKVLRSVRGMAAKRLYMPPTLHGHRVPCGG